KGQATRISDSIPFWQLTRGLPIRSPGGSLLARSRRQLAGDMVASIPEIESVAELDGRGRVRFLYPDRSQIALKTFDLSILTTSIPQTGDNAILFHKSFFLEDDTSMLSIVCFFLSSGGPRYLVTTLGPKFLSLSQPPGDSPTSFGVFGDAGEMMMHAGNV